MTAQELADERERQEELVYSLWRAWGEEYAQQSHAGGSGIRRQPGNQTLRRAARRALVAAGLTAVLVTAVFVALFQNPH